MNKRIFTFDEGQHIYTDDRNFAYTSVTTLIHEYVPKFDALKHAKRLARSGKGHYKGKSYKEILAMWDEVTEDALKKGNNRHNFLEDNVKDATGFTEYWKNVKRGPGQMYTILDILDNPKFGLMDLDKLERSVGIRYPKIWEAVKYYVDLGFRVYSEIVVYNEKYLISGMIDILFVHPDRRFVILDWKTNKHDMLFESGYFRRDDEQQTTKEWVKKAEYFLAPVDGLEHCNGNVYSMQLSTYSKLAEELGLKLEYIIIAHIREHYQANKYGMPYRDNKGKYITVPELGERVDFHAINYYKGHVDNMMNHHFNNTMGIYGHQQKMFR